MQMTMQLGAFPSALTGHSDLRTRPCGFPSQGRGPSAPCPEQQAPCSQQVYGSTGRQHLPAQQKSLAGSLNVQKGKLDLLHEVACPLHLELAKVDPDMASLVMAMLRYDPEQRVSAAEALQHPFLSELSPVLQLFTAKREADGNSQGRTKSQGRAVGSSQTLAQGISQQHFCQAEGESLEQAAGTLCPARQFGLPFKPEPRRQAIFSLPTGGLLTSHSAVPTWAVRTLPVPGDPLLPACQPQLQATQPQLQAARPKLKAAQPQLQTAKPQLQTSQPQLQPPLSTRAPPLVQRPIVSLPNSTAGMAAAEVMAPPTASAEPAAAASATDWHNLPEVTAHNSRDVQLPAVLPAVVPPLGPSACQTDPLLASHGITECTLPAHDPNVPWAPPAAATLPLPAQPAEPPSPPLAVATCPLPPQQADPHSAPLTVGSSPTTAVLTTIPRQHRASGDGLAARSLRKHCPSGPNGRGHEGPALGSGQGRHSAEGAVDSTKEQAVEQVAGAVATPMALGQGPVKTPGLVKAWNGVTELLQQMSPGSQVIPLVQTTARVVSCAFHIA